MNGLGFVVETKSNNSESGNRNRADAELFAFQIFICRDGCTRPNDSNGLCPKTFSFNWLRRISPVLFLSAVTEKERKRIPFKRDFPS